MLSSQIQATHGIAGEGRSFLYSSLQLQLVHEHPDVYLQFSIWDGCHIILIAEYLITRLLLDDIFVPLGITFQSNVNSILSCWFNARSYCSISYADILKKNLDFFSFSFHFSNLLLPGDFDSELTDSALKDFYQLYSLKNLMKKPTNQLLETLTILKLLIKSNKEIEKTL